MTNVIYFKVDGLGHVLNGQFQWDTKLVVKVYLSAEDHPGDHMYMSGQRVQHGKPWITRGGHASSYMGTVLVNTVPTLCAHRT